MQRINAVLISVALLLGLGSVAGVVAVDIHERAAVCHQASVQNQQTRDFLSELFNDPRVSKASADGIRKLAVKHFPLKGC